MRFIAKKSLLSAQPIMSFIIRFPVTQTARPETSSPASCWGWNSRMKWRLSGAMPSTSTARERRSVSRAALLLPEGKFPFLRFWWFPIFKHSFLNAEPPVSALGRVCIHFYIPILYILKYKCSSIPCCCLPERGTWKRSPVRCSPRSTTKWNGWTANWPDVKTIIMATLVQLPLLKVY